MTDDTMSLVYLIALLALVATFGFRSLGSLGKAAKNLIVVAGLFFALIVAYSFRDDAGALYARITGELVPGTPREEADGSVVLRRGMGGHFRARANVNGQTVDAMVDTGASMVVIPYEEAERLGLGPAGLRFSMPVTTANGMTYVAPVSLDTVRIGPIEITGVRGAVAPEGVLEDALLGLTFLDELRSYSFERNRLVLVP